MAILQQIIRTQVMHQTHHISRRQQLEFFALLALELSRELVLGKDDIGIDL